MIKIPHKIAALASVMLPVGMALLLAACDVFQDDVAPDRPIAENEVHVLKNSNAYIDFNKLVNAQGKISVLISKGPQKGTLVNVAAGLLKYSPNGNFTNGQDVFSYSVFNANQELLKQDSVIIIVEDDTTHLPCGLYAQDDYVYAAGSPVVIEAWQNDIICGDTSDLKIEVYRPDHTFSPHQGTAYIVADRIWYEPYVTDGNVTDTIIYRISKISNPSVYAYASVYVNINPETCQLGLEDDSYILDQPLGYDSLLLTVLMNDQLCDSVLSFNVVEYPHNGQVGVRYNEEVGFHLKYYYTLTHPDSAIYDSLRYKVCSPQECRTAVTRIQVY